MGSFQAFITNSLPLSRQRIREKVARRWGFSVSEVWIRRFIVRKRAHLRARTCDALGDKRMRSQILAEA